MLAASLQELAPHGDRDHFVYVVAYATAQGEPASGIQVEHMTGLESAGEFEVTLSENGLTTGHLRIRDDGVRLVVLTEDDLTRDLRLSYDPPLTYLAMPLLAGEQRAVATGHVSRLSDGQPTGTLQVTQVMQLSAAPPVHTRLGTYDRVVALRTVRTLQSPAETVELHTSALLVPGIGEVRSEGGLSGVPNLRRELACAIIAGRSIGDCRHLTPQPKESTHAGPTDLP